MPKMLTPKVLELLFVLSMAVVAVGVFMGVFPYIGAVNRTSYFPGYDHAHDLLFDLPKWMVHAWIVGLASVPIGFLFVTWVIKARSSMGEIVDQKSDRVENSTQGFGKRLLHSAIEWTIALLGLGGIFACFVGTFIIFAAMDGYRSYVRVGASEAAECSSALHDFALKNGRHEFIGKDYRLMIDVESAYREISGRYPDCSRLVRDYGRRFGEAEAREVSREASSIERYNARRFPRFRSDSLGMIEALKAADGHES